MKSGSFSPNWNILPPVTRWSIGKLIFCHLSTMKCAGKIRLSLASLSIFNFVLCSTDISEFLCLYVEKEFNFIIGSSCIFSFSKHLFRKEYNMHLYVHASVWIYVYGVPLRVAKLRAASPCGLPDGDLAALSLCALWLRNEDFRARQTNCNKVPCCDWKVGVLTHMPITGKHIINTLSVHTHTHTDAFCIFIEY